ncbi:MAG TPA: glycosyltransferase family 4 protein [Gemmatimonadaceae bacterium]
MEGLRHALEDFATEIELGIAAPGSVDHGPFRAGNATYFRVDHRRAGGGLRGATSRWRHAVPDGALTSCAEIAREFRPDLVHVHGSEHYFGLVLERVSTPAIVSLQGLATVCERFVLSGAGCADVVREIPTREFARGYGLLHEHWSMRARAAVERRVFALCSDFMGRTEWDQGVLGLLAPGSVYHHVDEVLGAPFYTSLWAGPNSGDGVVFCTIGQSALKGLECLLAAMIILRRSGLRTPRLRVAGSALEGGLARRLRAMVSEPEIAGRVEFLGNCTSEAIAQGITGASVFVLPSHLENSPNSLCEAMLVGAPCVASFVGGVPSLVRHGVDGLLYHDADPFALAIQIDRLLGNPALARRLGAEARAKALQRHDPRRIAESVVRAYRSVLAGPRPDAAVGRAGEAEEMRM